MKRKMHHSVDQAVDQLRMAWLSSRLPWLLPGLLFEQTTFRPAPGRSYNSKN